MAEPLFFLTQADLVAMKELVSAFRNGRLSLRPGPIDDTHQAPEVYVALVPEEGLPALQRLGTGTTEQDGDTPGSVVCEIFRLIDGRLQSIGRSFPIYNLGGDVSHGWVLVQRDKFGTWWVSTAGSSSDDLLTEDVSVVTNVECSGGNILLTTAWIRAIQTGTA